MRERKYGGRAAGVAILAAASLALAGCGGSTAAADAEGSGEVPAEVLIGATLPLTGAGAAYGKLMLDGLQLGVDTLNESGYIEGTTFSIDARDSQAEANLAVSQTRELISEGAVAIVTAYTAPPLAQTPVAARDKVPVFNGGGSDPVQLEMDYLWGNVMMITQEAEALMGWAKDELDVADVGILFQTSFTANAGERVQEAAERVFGTPATLEKADHTATTVGPQLDRLIAADPDAIYLQVDGTTASIALKELVQRNVDIPILTSAAGLGVPEALDSPSLQLYGTSQVSNPTEEFSAAYATLDDYADQQPPNMYFMNYYSIAQIIAQALKTAADEGLPANGDGIEQVLNTFPTFETAAGQFTFTESHGASGEIEIMKVEDGKPTSVGVVEAPAV
ncbi:ABC transporter substrate-binding protein [Microbacterium sp. RD1]|uniref:ABC transporter substrate-binding protein n=1 Tax=Microbacterium sp. RD1 TaxID=3457313 RepID=UPI003FA5CB73